MSIVLPRLTLVPSPNWSERNAKVDLILLHDCQGSFGGSVNWFSQPASRVSAHYVVSENGLEAAQMVSLDKAAWHAMEMFNHRSVAIEMAGWANRGFLPAEWDAAASIIAYILKKFSIPAQWAKKGSGPGFCRHSDLFGIGGNTHTDPGVNDTVWGQFVQKVQGLVAAGGFPASWDPDHTGNAKTFALPSTPHPSAQAQVHPVGR